MAISLELTKEIQGKLDKFAVKTERSRSQVIRLAIKKFLEGESGN